MNQTVTGTRRHGKLIIVELSGGGLWTIHLGMTGQVICAPCLPDVRHVHVKIAFTDDGTNLFYRDMRQFGHMSYCADDEALDTGPLRNFGPDALTIGAQELAASLAGRKAPLKALLLDQRVLAGVGNIYADECLHISGLHPQARPADLSPEDFVRLHQAIGQTLRRAIEMGGSSVKNFMDAEGRAGTFQETHRVYRRTGQPCPVCGQKVERTTVAGRSTHFCPDCQTCRLD